MIAIADKNPYNFPNGKIRPQSVNKFKMHSTPLRILVDTAIFIAWVHLP